MINCDDDMLINNNEDLDLDNLNDNYDDDFPEEKEDLTQNDIFSILSEAQESRASSKRKQKSDKNIIMKSNKKKIEPIKVVNTQNAVENKNKDVEKYYKKSKSKSNDSEDNASINIGNNVPLNEVDRLKEVIKLFLTIDEKCTKLNEEVKECKAEKKQYEDHILNFMGEYEKEKIPCSNTVLKREVKRIKTKPKEEDILSTLTDILKDGDVASNITRKIFDSMPDEEKISLKREDDDKKPPKKPTKKQVKTS